MEAHKNHLNNLCRVCGKRPKGYIHKKTSDACQSLLSSELGIHSVASESVNVYPPGICNSCYLILKQKNKGEIKATNLTEHKWLPHDEEECQICMAPQSTGGKPKRRKVTLEVKGRPNSSDTARAVLSKVADLTIPHYADSPVTINSFLMNPLLADLACR